MNQVAKNALEREKSNVENLRSDASQVADDMMKLGNAIQGLAADSWEGVQRRLSNIYENGQQKVAEAEKRVERTIKERPLQALLLAAGVGFIIGWLKKK